MLDLYTTIPLGHEITTLSSNSSMHLLIRWRLFMYAISIPNKDVRYNAIITFCVSLVGSGGEYQISSSFGNLPSSSSNPASSRRHGSSTDSYQRCVQSETSKYRSQYTSVTRVEVTSIKILVQEHFSYCK